MSVFGIVVEGPSDTAVYSAIISKIRPDVQQVICGECGGVASLKRSFVGRLRGFEYRCVDKAIVIRDCDGKDPREVEADLMDRLKNSHFEPRFPVHFYATKSMVETWLLADARAVREVARLRGHNHAVKEVNVQEENRNAKTLFYAMLSQAGLPADPKVYGEIATEADIDIIEGCCPYFLKFREHIHAC